MTESDSSSTDFDEKQLNDAQDLDHNSLDFRTFKLEKYVKIFPWLYYHSVDKGYKCKTCEMFPSIGLGGHSQNKFGKTAVKSLTDHPQRLLRGHEASNKHMQATRELEGT